MSWFGGEGVLPISRGERFMRTRRGEDQGHEDNANRGVFRVECHQISRGECHQILRGECHQNSRGECHQISGGECHQTINRGVPFHSIPFQSSPFHSIVLMTLVLPSPCPYNSGPIQWARGGIGLKPSTAARAQIVAPAGEFCGVEL